MPFSFPRKPAVFKSSTIFFSWEKKSERNLFSFFFHILSCLDMLKQQNSGMFPNGYRTALYHYGKAVTWNWRWFSSRCYLTGLLGKATHNTHFRMERPIFFPMVGWSPVIATVGGNISNWSNLLYLKNMLLKMTQCEKYITVVYLNFSINLTWFHSCNGLIFICIFIYLYVWSKYTDSEA